MAHQITETDSVYLAEQGAWHGLGKVFPKALNGEETRKVVCPWEPVPRYLTYYATDPKTGGTLQRVPDRKVILRSDNHGYLGTVGMGFKSVGNKELFDLIETALPGCKYETAGTLFGGSRVWALARMGSFDAVKGDENKQYLMVANGHDGTFRVFFGQTTVRVVCNNTLTAAIAGGEIAAYKHTSGVTLKLEYAAKAIAKAQDSAQEFAKQAKGLAARKLNAKQVNEYFLSVFPSPAEEKSGKAFTRHNNVLSALGDIYTSERNAGRFGSNLWTAFNTVTDYVDHLRQTRGTDDTSRAENKFSSLVWGSGNDLKQKALQLALNMAI